MRDAHQASGIVFGMTDVRTPPAGAPDRHVRARRALGVAGRRLARAPDAGSRSRARPVNVDRPRRGRSRSSSSTASGGRGATGSRTSPTSPREPPRDRDRPARASAHSPMPAEKISIPGYGRIVDELLRHARHRARGRSSATRWAASSAPRWRSSSPTRVEQARARLRRGPVDRAPAQRARAARCSRGSTTSSSSARGWIGDALGRARPPPAARGAQMHEARRRTAPTSCRRR